MKYQPKGGMCMVCVFRSLDCSGLPFAEMPVLERKDDTVVVKCIGFKKFNAISEELREKMRDEYDSGLDKVPKGNRYE